MKKLELIITQSKKTKVTIVLDEMSDKDQFMYIQGILNKDLETIIFEDPSQELLNINEITEWDVIE